MQDPVHVNHPEVEAALAMTQTFRQDNRAFANIGIYRQRLTRQFERTVAQLRQIQAERREAEQKELGSAATILKMHKKDNLPYEPAEDGFVFSKAEIETFIRRQERRERANYEDFYENAGVA